MFSRLVIAVAMALGLSAAGAAAQGFAGAPFKCGRLMEKPQWLVEAVAVNNWLNDSASALTEEQAQVVRERLYLLVNAEVQDWYQRRGSIAYADSVPLLPLLLGQAGRLGTIGSAQAARALAKDSRIGIPDAPAVPEGFRLTFDSTYFHLSSARGWAVEFPYYFMVGQLGDRLDREGGTFQFAQISTATARHEGLAGASQATILVVQETGADPQKFRQKWLARIQLSEGDESAVARLAGALTFRGRDAESGMRKEMSFLHSPGGELALAYIGLPGTYECNEPDFAAFAATLRLGPAVP